MIFPTIAVLLSTIYVGHGATITATSRSSTSTEKPSEKKISALYLISSKGDYIGQGSTKAYIEEQDNKFSISTDRRNAVDINFSSPKDQWHLSFSAAGNLELTPGIYKNATRYPFNETTNPGFSIYGCGRGCNTLKAEFEILELKYDDQGKIDAFAANFIQKCELKGPPLFGSVRYHSAIPVEARFSEIFDNIQDTFLYIIERNPETNESLPILITDDNNNFTFQKLPYDGKGFELLVESEEEGSWTLDFAAPLNESFIEGDYAPAYRYPFHSSVYSGIDILTPRGSFTQPEGGFEVMKITRGKEGEIQSLALNFKVKNEKGEIIEGAIRFNSKLPVDLDKPYW